MPARAEAGHARAPREGRTTRKLHVSGCHTCVGVELSGLDIVTVWCRPNQGLTATGDSSAMDSDRWAWRSMRPTTSTNNNSVHGSLTTTGLQSRDGTIRYLDGRDGSRLNQA